MVGMALPGKDDEGIMKMGFIILMAPINMKGRTH